MKQFAAIFDMDGTLVDNNPYHFKTWKQLFEKYNRVEVTTELYNEKLSGVPGMVIMREFFGDDYSEDEMKEMFDEKTRIYKEEYGPHVTAINGLERLLIELKNAGVKTAVASSATASNIDFVLDKLPIKPYFDTIVDGPRISKPKPNPQIFLKAAEDLGIKPESCVVFEDSLSGVKAANAAGMKVAAITTTHQAEELHPVDLIIADYTGLTVQKLAALFEEKKHE
ncbi:HAD family hydrolase [Mucilaginibacter lacusdianchii]|uniref:HAD family hydrolase n=1 Tax=Mucilaginibacter lacusdianchii TaxID=2684211 RepID=UPI00131BDE59|nr:HAD family phosphatase [Mucilaginibacter sp. JXJ CY 39]